MLKQSTLFLILLLIIPTYAHALGFGDLTVYSKLNEPLKVHIRIVDSNQLETDDIIVRNASRTTYKRANLPRPEIFKKVRFKTIKTANGSLAVELSTEFPLREPFFTFILEMKRGTAMLNREFTFLLDPPEHIQQNNYPKKKETLAAPKKSTAVRKSTVKTPSKRIKPQRNINYKAAITSQDDSDTYTIRVADTLWDIAKKFKPDNKVTTYQTMQALYALNPDAFINSNINLLRPGTVLRIPSSNDVREINAMPLLSEENISTPKNINSSAVTKKQKKITPAGSDQLSENKEKTSTKTPERQARLKIISPTQELLNKPITNKEDLLIINKSLETSISTIESLKTENDKLRDKVDQLTNKLNKFDAQNKSLNDKITEITQKLKEQENKSADINTDMAAAQSNDESLKPQVSKQKNNTPIEIASDIAHTRNQKSFIRELLANPIISLALAIFTIIVLITTLFTIRTQNDKRKARKARNVKNSISPVIDTTATEEQQNTISEDTNSDSESYLSSLQNSSISPSKDEEDMDFFEYFEKKINAPYEGHDTEFPEIVTSTEHNNSANSKPEDTDREDVIKEYKKITSQPHTNTIQITMSEVDTYFAYGNYETAETLLLNEIKLHPADKNLVYKLFECYSYANQREKFISHAKKYIDLLNTDMTLRHRVENIFQHNWKETLDISKL